MFGIWDNQLSCYKEGMEFESEKEAYESYRDSLVEQAIDGNCGYDEGEFSEEETKAELDAMTDKEIFEMYGYEVMEIEKDYVEIV